MFALAIYFRGGKLSVDKNRSHREPIISHQEKQNFC